MEIFLGDIGHLRLIIVQMAGLRLPIMKTASRLEAGDCSLFNLDHEAEPFPSMIRLQFTWLIIHPYQSNKHTILPFHSMSSHFGCVVNI